MAGALAPTDRCNAILRRNNVRVVGSGPRTLVFSHGFGADQRMWRLLTPYFERDYRLVLFDLVGSGASDLNAYRRSRYDSLDGYADDLLELLDALDLRDVGLIAHSISGMIAVRAANKAPERFAALAMLGASARYLNDDAYHGGFDDQDLADFLYLLESNHEVWAEQMAPLVMANADRPELAQELANSFYRLDPVIARHFAEVALRSDSREAAARCRTPTLIVQCTQDVIAPVTVGEYLHRVMPVNEYILMDASGHFPHLSAPDATARVVRAFIDERMRNGG